MVAAKEINEESPKRIKNVENRIAEADFFTRMFVKRTDEYNNMVKKTDEFISNTAKTISNEIAALETTTTLTSYDQYTTLKSKYTDVINIVDKYVKDHPFFGNQVKSKITNYNLVEKYKEDLDDLLETYAVKCTYCGGDGKNSRSCSSCNGRGKKLVTWYSHGDWGSTSYSSYTCTSCNGSGRKTYSCYSCTGGYNYVFEQPTSADPTLTDSTVTN